MKSTLKTTIILISFSLFAFAANAQEKHVGTSNWKELKEFHSVMAQTFHPAEEGNLTPIRERAAELHKKAIALAESKIPADFDNEEVRTALKELSDKSAEVEKLVSNKAADDEIMAALSSAHDSFHKIVGLCQKGDHSHDHDHEKEGSHKH